MKLCDLLAIQKDGTELIIASATLDDIGALLSRYYSELSDYLSESGLTWSEITGFRVNVPEGYLVD